MFKRSFSIIAILLAIGCTIYLYLINRGNTIINAPHPLSWSVSLPASDTSFGGIFFNPIINDSLPYYEYRRRGDSVKRIQETISLANKSIGTGRGLGAISVVEIPKDRTLGWSISYEGDAVYKALRDSLDLLMQRRTGLKAGDSLINIDKLSGEVIWRLNVRSNELSQQEDAQQEKLYYLGLSGYTTNDFETKFFMDKGTYNLAYVIWDSINKRTFDSTKHGHYERKKIAVRYAADEKKVLIPLTKQQHQFTELALEWGSYLMIFFAAYFFLGMPIQIVLNISKGKAFTTKNIQRLKWMSIALCAYSLFAILSPYFLHWYYKSLIPEEFQLQPFSRTLFNNLYQLLIALGIFLLSKAFERGYKLQQENALTI